MFSGCNMLKGFLSYNTCRNIKMEAKQQCYCGFLIIWTLILITSCVAIPTEMLTITTSSSLSNIIEENTEPSSQIQNLTCHDILAEKEYLVLSNGSLLLPQSQQLFDSDVYVIQNGTAFICTTADEANDLVNETTGANYNFSNEFISCGHILIEPHEFKLMTNRTIYVSIYQKYYEPIDYYYLKEKGVYVCLPNYGEMVANSSDVAALQSVKFSVAFVYISLVGLGVSIISLILHLTIFCCVLKVRNLPGFCLASLSISLLLAYFCFVSSSMMSNTDQCAPLGLCVYYFFLTSFFWMNVIAFDIWRSFRVVIRELRISSHRVPWRRFLIYSAYSWFIPALLVALAKVADTTDILPEDFRPSFGSPICWFGQRKALLVFFATPLFLVMALNAIFFLDSAYVISRATIKTSQHEKRVLTRRFFMFMRLALLMGLTWIVGIFAGYVNQQVLWYVFVVLNTLQGLFIFIVFSCSSKVRILLLLIIRGGVNKRQNTSVRTISQASGAL